jgi:isopentenyl-diphosphate delta-isomerase
MELITVVNELDEVIGNSLRKHIDVHGGSFRTVSCLVRNSKGEVLLHRRSKEKRTGADKWTFSSYGCVQAGEEYIAAAVREIGEELGISITTEQLLPTFYGPLQAGKGKEFLTMFTVCWDGPIVPDKTEISEVDWFMPEDVAQFISDNDPEITDRLKALWPVVVPKIKDFCVR